MTGVLRSKYKDNCTMYLYVNFCKKVFTFLVILTKHLSPWITKPFLNVSGGSNLVRRGSCDSSSDSEHVSGAETYVSFTGGPHKHSNPDIVKGVSFEINT